MTSLFAQMFPGMELIPLMVLALAGATICSVVGFFVAFFHRTAARILASLVYVSIAAFALLVLAGNRWSLSRLLQVLLTHSPTNWIVAASSLLAIAAAFAPLRCKKTAASNPFQTRERPRWSVFVVACLTALLLLGYGAWEVVEGRRGEAKTRALLSGAQDVHFERFQIDGQQQRVLCSDPEVLRYLEERFREGKPPSCELGTTYQLTVHYAEGGSFSMWTYWNESGTFALSMPEDADFGPSRDIALKGPRPKAVAELLTFLTSDLSDHQGTVLILEAERSRRERDESLVAK